MKFFEIFVHYYKCDDTGIAVTDDAVEGSFYLPARLMSKSTMITFCSDYLLAFVKFYLHKETSPLYSLCPCIIRKSRKSRASVFNDNKSVCESYTSTNNVIFAFGHYYNFNFDFFAV